MSLLNKLVAKAESEAGLHYRNPKLPHACSIPGGLSCGSKVYIHGMVPKDATGFSVSFQRGADVEHADVYLHFSTSFGDSPVVVRNARRSGVWGVEERTGKVPFTVATPFILAFVASLDCFEIEVTGSPFESFKVRDGLPISSITHLAIQGCLAVWAIHIPVENMPRNHRLSIPGQAKVGDMVFLRGSPTPGAQNFVVNVQSGPGKSDDIMFHFSPRLSENKVAMNSRLDEEWGKEETGQSMPFTESKPFDLVIASSSLGYETWVDGKVFASFNHRYDITNASTIFIEGDLSSENIVIDSAQSQMPSEWMDGFKLNNKATRLQIFCPELPLLTRITGGLDKGCLLLMSGELPKEPKRFCLCLQCDSADDSDIVLQYSQKWDDSDAVLALNSRDEEKWGTEVRVKEEKLLLVPGLHFDLAILFTGEQFRIAANGLHQADFPMRLDGVRPDHVAVSGDVIVHRILVA